MRRWITRDDIIDVYHRILQRGWQFIRSKISLQGKQRTLSAFDDAQKTLSNWWIIPAVKQRWNEKITGDPNLMYEDYLVQRYFRHEQNLKLLSIGSGVCSHELALAKYSCFDTIHCTDIATSLLEKAAKTAKKNGLRNITFEKADIYEKDFGQEHYDIVFFHAALHHFEDMSSFIPHKILPILKPGGFVIINEYVGPDRLQYSGSLLKAANKALSSIPQQWRVRHKSSWLKKSISGSGHIRMVIADPSECIDSSSIIPTLHEHMQIVEEKPYGGNLLMPVLKDIAHHFVYPDGNNQEVLNQLFTMEDNYLLNADSHFIFGVYQKK